MNPKLQWPRQPIRIKENTLKNQWSQLNCPKRGKTQATKSWSALLFHQIGWEKVVRVFWTNRKAKLRKPTQSRITFIAQLKIALRLTPDIIWSLPRLDCYIFHRNSDSFSLNSVYCTCKAGSNQLEECNAKIFLLRVPSLLICMPWQTPCIRIWWLNMRISVLSSGTCQYFSFYLLWY